MKIFLFGLLALFLWIAVFYVPLVVVMWRARKARDAYEAEAKEPFTDFPLRLPGESTRKKADDLFEKAVEWMLMMALSSAIAGMAVAMTPAARQPVIATTMAVIVVGLAIYAGPKVLQALRNYWDYKLGFTGERIVAEELNQLLAHGWRIFHDVPFKEYNVDHVAVGPPGVFAIETKAKRKRKDLATAYPAHMVKWDGTLFTWPDGKRDKFGLEQAAINAKSVAEFLSKSTGESVSCQPVLTLPGWFIEATGRGNAIVASTKGLHKVLPKCGSTPLSPVRIQQIAFQLEQKCRPNEKAAS